MSDAINNLNRDTIARSNGIDPGTQSMNHFLKLMFEKKEEDMDLYYNRLLYIHSYDGLDEELKKEVESKIVEINNMNSKNLEGQKVR